MNSWFLVDTETDGLYHPIFTLEIAAQRFKGLEPEGEPFRVFINHEIDIPPEATEIHGYTREFLKNNGLVPIEAHELFREVVGDKPLCAHYLQFDWNRVLTQEWQRLGIKQVGQKGFCSWKVARRTLTEFPTHRLDFLREKLDLRCSKPHTALGDVESATDLLVRHIFPRLSNVGIDSFLKVGAWTACSALECKCLLNGLDYRQEKIRIAEEKRRIREEQQAKADFVAEVEMGAHSLPEIINGYGLVEEEPKIQFEGKKFMFTGKMKWGTRPQAEEIVRAKGGEVSMSRNFNSTIDYLVLGEDPEKGWTSLLTGTKLTKAFLNKFHEPDSEFSIILEGDFVSSI
jgi:DNA polymerase-3 subunit epsilon